MTTTSDEAKHPIRAIAQIHNDLKKLDLQSSASEALELFDELAAAATYCADLIRSEVEKTL